MKNLNTKLLGLLLAFSFSDSTGVAQNDTMYIMKSGVIVGKYNVNTEVDSVIFYKTKTSNQTNGTFTDSRDGNVYNWVKIGNQVWMAENLKYLPDVVHSNTQFNAQGSNKLPGYGVFGYDGSDVATAKFQANYTTYGVLYNWWAAMNSSYSSSTNPSGVKGICPTGWHLPSDAEWTELTDIVGNNAGTKLKSTIGWDSGGNGTDEFGFTALPGGYRIDNGSFYHIGSLGRWWSATEDGDGAIVAWGRYMDSGSSSVYRDYGYSTKLGYSVRCVRDQVRIEDEVVQR